MQNRPRAETDDDVGGMVCRVGETELDARRGTIGLIWSLLYPVIAITFGYVFVQAVRRKVPRAVALPFAVNLVANLIFTPIQFGLRNLPLAAVDILVVLGSIVWCTVAVWPHARWVAVAQVPYLAWVGTATVLQLSITLWNW